MVVATFVQGFHHGAGVEAMEYRPLGATGLQVSVMGLGGGPLGGLYGQDTEEEQVAMVQDAIRSGINYIDTAPWYGQGRSERLLGKALRGVPRSAYYIGTKVGRYEKEIDKMFDFSAERVKQSVDHSLDLLGLDYVDVIQVHDLEFAENLDVIINETMPALQAIVDQGKARHIGITGYPLSVLREVVERSSVKVEVVLSYARSTLIDDTLSQYLPFFKSRGIGVVNASIVAMGLLRDGEPPSWHPAPNDMKEAAIQAAAHCKAAGVDLARVAVRHATSLPDVSTHLIGCDNTAILKANLDVMTSLPSQVETKLAQEVRSKFFAPLPRKEWEGGYLDQYFAELREIRRGKKSGGGMGVAGGGVGVATYVAGFHNMADILGMEYRPLGNTGLRVSKMGLGGSPLGGLYGQDSEEEQVAMVQDAIRSGINYIDTAPWYGQGKSERLLGKALRDVPREAYYIGTKVGRYEWEVEKMFDFSAERVKQSVNHSLDLLGLDYVDFIQVHDVEFAESLDVIINETLPALQAIVNQGKARHIGITGYPLSVLREVVERSSVKVEVVLSYARNTLIDDTLSQYLPFFKSQGIGVIDAGALALGLLRDGNIPWWHPAPHDMKVATINAMNHCKAAGVDLARVAVRHATSLPDVSTYLIGCDNTAILKANLDVMTSPPSQVETKLAQEVRTKFFSSLARKEWEGGYLDQYWKQRLTKEIRQRKK